MIVLRSPKGWTGPKEVDGQQVEGTWRSHQVPLGEVSTNPEHLSQLQQWLESYRPEELFDDRGRLLPETARNAPAGPLRMSATPHANGGLLLRPLTLPDYRQHAVDVAEPGVERISPMMTLGPWLRDVIALNPGHLPALRPGRDGIEPAAGRLRGHRQGLAVQD